MSLSPWPAATATVAHAAAVSLLKDSIDPGLSNETVARLGAVAAARVEKYAEDAPEAVKNEAVIRLAGYMNESGKRQDFGALRADSIDPGGAIKIDKTFNPASGAFRRSGAMSLLSPWRVRQ